MYATYCKIRSQTFPKINCVRLWILNRNFYRIDLPLIFSFLKFCWTLSLKKSLIILMKTREFPNYCAIVGLKVISLLIRNNINGCLGCLLYSCMQSKEKNKWKLLKVTVSNSFATESLSYDWHTWCGPRIHN